MPKRSPRTPRSQIRSALRRLWLRSRERASALKRDGYSCQECGKKQSKAKGREVFVEVHHLEDNMIDHITDLIAMYLLCHPDGLQCLCKGCHQSETEKQRRRMLK